MTDLVELPVFAIRDGLLYPGAVAPFDVARPRSRAAIEFASASATGLVLVATIISRETEEPLLADLHPVGCTARVVNRLPTLHGAERVILHGQARVVLRKVTRTAPALHADVALFPRLGALSLWQRLDVVRLRYRAKAFVRSRRELPTGAAALIDSVRNPESLVDLIASNMEAPIAVKLRLLDIPFDQRLKAVLDWLAGEMASTRAR